MKKIFILVLLFLFPLCVYAADETVFSVNEVTASPGNNVKITLNLNNKQKFGVLTGRIKYDKNKLTYVSHELSGLKNGMLKGAENNEEKGLVAIYGITLSASKLMNDNGNILSIEFKIKDDVTEDIPIEIEIKDFGVDEEKSLPYKVNNGIIHIKSNVSSVKKEDNEKAVNDLKEELKKKEVKEDDITITSSDEDVATVDENGNIEFKNDGNVTIEAKDKEGNVVYSKDYLVNNKVKKINKYIKPIIYIGLSIIAIIIILITRKKKWAKKR